MVVVVLPRGDSPALRLAASRNPLWECGRHSSRSKAPLLAGWSGDGDSMRVAGMGVGVGVR